MPVLRTFTIQYPTGHRFADCTDEIDGRGATPADALADAQHQAADLYAAGFQLIETASGGSGSLARF